MQDATHDVFLSHHSADKPAVEALARRLREAGLEPWLDMWNLTPGKPWQDEIEQALDGCKTCAVFIGPHGMGTWQNEEMRAAINRRVSKGGYRVIPVLLPGAERDKRSSLPNFLTATTWVEFRSTLEDDQAFHRLVCGIRGVAPGASIDADIDSNECPYRGLQVFDREHAPLFFGRRALTEWLLNAIRPRNEDDNSGNRFLAMLGASGSGKSSLARAGLLAPLQNGALPDSQHWSQIILKPGAKPLESLAIALCNDPELGKGKHPADLIKQFKQHDNQLHWQCRQALHGLPESRRVVILIDQFEEVFTLCADEAARQAFINNLLTAATDVTGQAIILLTLRADFYGKCAAYSQLAAALSDEQFLIEPMSEDDLRQAIEQPALRAGCELEAGLVDVLLTDVKDQAGSLPLLEYTLTRLWETRTSRVLRLEDYRAFGGLAGALNQRADEIYEKLPEPQQAICQHIFLRLVQLGEGTEDTRRRATFDEFGNDEATEKVIQKLANVRLITTQQADQDNKAFAEVTHEALIRNWSQLKQWIDSNRESLKQQHQITQASKDWEQSEQDDAWLLTGTRLQLAEEWLEQHPDKLSDHEANFLTQSQVKHQQREAEKKAEQEKQARLLKEKAELEKKQREMAELQAMQEKQALEKQAQLLKEKAELQDQQVKEQKKTLIRTRWFSGIMAVLTVLMLIAAGWAIKSANEAEIASQKAEKSAQIAEQKEAEAKKNLLDANYNLAKVFEKEAVQRLPDDEILQGKKKPNIEQLKQAMLYSLETARQEIPEDKKILDFALFGRLSLLREQDLTTATKRTPSLNIGRIQTLAYSPDGQFIASGSSDNTVRLWDASTGESLKTLQGHSGTIWSVAYSPDGQFIASGSDDNTVRLWDASTGESLKTLQGHSGTIWSVAYSPDGQFIASGSSDNTVRLWDLTSPLHRLLFDFEPGAVADALSLVWQMEREALQIVHKEHPSLFPHESYHITFTDKNRKYRSLLDMPKAGESKFGQIVRLLEEQCAYKKPERYGCEPLEE